MAPRAVQRRGGQREQLLGRLSAALRNPPGDQPIVVLPTATRPRDRLALFGGEDQLFVCLAGLEEGVRLGGVAQR
jgi:hypothetical protein